MFEIEHSGVGAQTIAIEDFLGDLAAFVWTAVIDDDDLPTNVGPLVEEPLQLGQFSPEEIFAVWVLGAREDALVLLVNSECHGDEPRPRKSEDGLLRKGQFCSQSQRERSVGGGQIGVQIGVQIRQLIVAA